MRNNNCTPLLLARSPAHFLTLDDSVQQSFAHPVMNCGISPGDAVRTVLTAQHAARTPDGKEDDTILVYAFCAANVIP